MAQTHAKARRRSWMMSPEEARAYFDEQAGRLLSMEGEQFVRAWEAGEFDDDSDRYGVIDLVLMLPLYYCSLREDARQDPC